MTRARNPTGSSAIMMVSALSTQASSALSMRIFARTGPAPASALRMVFAAVMMCALTRPNVLRVRRREWTVIVAFGLTMAAMNLCLYHAIDRLPLGVAVTLDFLGPCALVFVTAQRWRERLCAPVALLGVLLVAGPGGRFDAVGFAFGVASGVCFAGYAWMAERVGRQEQPLSRIALAVTVAAAVSLPLAATVAARLESRTVGIVLVAALLGVVVSYSCDVIAAAKASAATIALLFGLDPALAAVIGGLFLQPEPGAGGGGGYRPGGVRGRGGHVDDGETCRRRGRVSRAVGGVRASPTARPGRNAGR